MRLLRIAMTAGILASLVVLPPSPSAQPLEAADPLPSAVKDMPYLPYSSTAATTVTSVRPIESIGEGAFRDGELIVGLREPSQTQALGTLVQSTGGTITGQVPEIGAVLISVPTGSEEAAVESLNRSGTFRYVERNPLLRLPPSAEAEERQLVEDGQTIQFAPNDPYYSQQWGLTKIGAPYAWDINRGSATIMVSVIDSGYDVDHPDRPANLYVGPDYISGGYVSSDATGHGTHVAGIIGARTNNGIGVAGLSHNVSVGIVRVFDSSGATSAYIVASAIRWAADAGSRVINLSLGGPTDLTVLRDAITYAAARGVLVVAASGNCGAGGSGCMSVNQIEYPAAYPDVLAVGATTATDEIASYSGHRSYVSVAAPGSDVWSTYPRWYGSYASLDGTSMATPHVSALAALIWSVNPSLDSSQVRRIIESTASDKGTPGKDDYYGCGRIDASSALLFARSTSSASMLSFTTTLTTTLTNTVFIPAIFRPLGATGC